MKLVVIGSGTANPHPRRSSAGFWLENDGRSLMLDFGASALHRLAQEELDWPNLDAVWISHFHLDHCCGIAAYLFATKYAPETRERTKPLRVIGGEGTRRLLENFDAVNGYNLFAQPFPVEIIEVRPLESFEIFDGLGAVALSTPHTNESLAIRVENRTGASLVYTSDTGFGQEISAFARGTDLFVVEASFFKEKKTEIHLELAEAMYMIRKARPKRAMLTHFYAEWDDVDFGTEIGRFDPVCGVVQAFDGMRLEV